MPYTFPDLIKVPGIPGTTISIALDVNEKDKIFFSNMAAISLVEFTFVI